MADSPRRLRAMGLIVTLVLSLPTVLLTSTAQHAAQVPRRGLLMPGSSSDFAARLEAFGHGRRALGDVEGRHIAIEDRDAAGREERLHDLAAELGRRKVDVMMAAGAAIRAAQQATTTIPIVRAVRGHPGGDGLGASLAPPGGNITGLSLRIPAVRGKRLAFLPEAVPALSHGAVLWPPTVLGRTVAFKEPQTAAYALGLQLQSIAVRRPDECAQALAAMTREHADALGGIATELFFGSHRQLAELTVRHRRPAMFHLRE